MLVPVHTFEPLVSAMPVPAPMLASGPAAGEGVGEGAELTALETGRDGGVSTTGLTGCGLGLVVDRARTGVGCCAFACSLGAGAGAMAVSWNVG
jgi:hypothetical protein